MGEKGKQSNQANVSWFAFSSAIAGGIASVINDELARFFLVAFVIFTMCIIISILISNMEKRILKKLESEE